MPEKIAKSSILAVKEIWFTKRELVILPLLVQL